MILPTTLVLASESLEANFLSSLRTARTSSNVTLAPTFPSSFSTRIVLPGSARYCFPPVRITAYILLPEASDKPQSYRIQASSVNDVSHAKSQFLARNAGEISREIPWELWLGYQIVQRSSAGRTIASPALQSNAA